MSDFSDRPFVAGSLVGLRAFGIDSLGRLVGPSYGGVFKPGENEAECRKDRGGLTTLLGAYQMSFGPSSFTIPAGMFNVSRPVTPTNSYGTGSCPCGCGMEVEFHDDQPAGLASEAIAAPPTPKPTHTLGGVKCTCGFYAYFDGRNDYKEPNRVAAVVEGYGVCTVGARGFRASKARLLAIVEPKPMVTPMLREFIHRNYESVPFYATKREALNTFPLTPPSDMPTPADEDFWTRSAS